MLRRIVSIVVIAWALGFVWFAVTLPQPAGNVHTDAVVVPTGASGRIPRGLAVLREGLAGKMLVTGVDTDVTPADFAREYGVSKHLMQCCITLGFTALDTRGNAREATRWVNRNHFHSLRLVTSDWHMRRFALDLSDQLPANVRVVRDAVHSQPSFSILFTAYHKLLATYFLRLS